MNERKRTKPSLALLAMSAMTGSMGASLGMPIFEIKNAAGYGGGSKVRETAPSFDTIKKVGNLNTLNRDHHSVAQARRNAKSRKNVAAMASKKKGVTK